MSTNSQTQEAVILSELRTAKKNGRTIYQLRDAVDTSRGYVFQNTPLPSIRRALSMLRLNNNIVRSSFGVYSLVA